MIARVVPPDTEAELLERAGRLAGRTLGWIAGEHGVAVPADLRRDKGWIGQLLEHVLGATASSRAEPDFPGIGVEMKTLPVSARGVPRESTYVCRASFEGGGATWETCWLRRKLSRVLWVPIVGDASSPVGQRVVGSPLLWSPDAEEETALRSDWQELTELMHAGLLWQIDATRGSVLQLRPKGASSREMVWTMDDGGEWVRDNPRGFYLRPAFTGALVKKHFHI